jgi:acetyl esterase
MALDPQVRRFLDRLAVASPPTDAVAGVTERRDGLQQLLQSFGQREAVGRVEELRVPGPGGALAIRAYTPAGRDQSVLPAWVYFHGGGFVAGSLESHDGIVRSLANATGFRVFSVDYRLGPEHRFPAAVADGWAGAQWIAGNAATLGIDPGCLGVCGDSAGATLAALVCQQAAASGELRFALQFLLCPIMDFCADTQSRREFADGLLINRRMLESDLGNYLAAGVHPADPRISPLRARSVAGLPPSCIHTAQYDPVRDEGAAYAQRLQQAGVRTCYRCHPGMIHLFYGLGAVISYAATAFTLAGADIRSLLVPAGGEP